MLGNVKFGTNCEVIKPLLKNLQSWNRKDNTNMRLQKEPWKI